MTHPTVSVITPIFNCVDFVAETIQSVIEQSFSDWELLLVDDCSSDNSLEIAKQFARNDKRIKVIELNENSGAAVARNRGIEAAKGRYIAFLDSDDIWLPNKLEKQLQFMKDSGCPFTFTAYEKINEAGQVIGQVGVPGKVGYSDMLKTCYPGCLTVIYDTQFFGKVTMPLIRKRQDYGLWLKLLKMADFACGLQTVLAQYRVHSQSISAKKVDAVTYTWRLFRDVEKLPIAKRVYYFSHYFVRGVLRSRFPKLARFLHLLN